MLVSISALLFFGSAFLGISLRWPQVPILVWLATLMGIRDVVYVPTPGLPDITLDRLAMLWVTAVFAIKTVAEKKKLKGPFTLDIILILHGTYLLLSILMSESRDVNSWSRSYLMPYMAFIMAKYFMTDIKWIKRAFLLLFIMNIYHVFTSIAEHYHWNMLVWPKFILNREIGMQVPGRSRGIFLQSALFGTVMGMLLGIHLYYLRAWRTYVAKAFVLLTIGLGFLGLMFTYTRGCWLVATFAILAVGIIGWRQYSAWIARIVLAGIIIFMFGLVNVSSDRFLQRRMSTEHTVTGRINTAATALRIWRANPIFGVGFRKYQEVKYDYMATITVPVFGTIRRSEGFTSSLHDIYLGVLCEEGIVGFGLQLTIYFLLFQAFRRKYQLRKKGDHFSLLMMPAIGGMFVGYLIGGTAIDYRYFSAVGGLFYFMAGIVYGYEGDKSAQAETLPQRRPVRLQPFPVRSS
jgi:O-antigen ligase